MKKIFILTLFLTIILLTTLTSAYELEQDEEGNTIIKIDGEEYPIPSSMEVKSENDNLIFINKGPLEEFQFKELTISLKPNSELSYSEQNGLTTLDLKGEGDLTTKSNYLPNIKDAKISLKNNEITYAKLFATEDETYFFDHNDKLYEFDVKKDGLIIFNPKEKIIEGENAELYLEDKKISGNDFTIYLDNRDISQALEGSNTITLTDSEIKAKGKVNIETESFSYEGLTDSTEFSVETIDGELKAHIDGNEDKSLAEGGIAKFSKKFEIGDLLAEKGFITEQSTIDTIITRENGIVGLHASTNSLGSLAEIERNPTKFAIIKDTLSLDLGDNNANLKINSNFGMHYKNSQGSTNILSPSKTHFYLGDDKNTVTEIIKYQIQNKEDFNIQLLSIQKIYELGTESKISIDSNNKELGFKGFESSLESFSETKNLIKNLYENDLQKSSALSSFILQNLESIEPDFTTQKYESGQVYFTTDKSQEARKESLIKSSLEEVKQNLNPAITDYNQDLSNIKSILNQQASQNEGIIPPDIKSLVESQFQSQILYEKLATTHLEDHEQQGVIDSYRALLTLEDTKIIQSDESSTFESDPSTFSTRKLNLAEALATEYAKNNQLSDSIAVLDGINQNFRDFVSNLAKQPGELKIENAGLSDDEQFSYNLNSLRESGQGEIAETLSNIKRKIDLNRNAVADTGFNRIQLDLYTQAGEIQKIFDVRKGYSDRVRDSLGTEEDLSTIVFSGGFGKDIVDIAGGFDKVKLAASILKLDNQAFSEGTYGIQSLSSLGVDSQIIEDWVNGRLSRKQTIDLANNLLLQSGRARPNPVESKEFPGQDAQSNREIDHIGLTPYSFDSGEREQVLEFLAQVRPSSETTYYSDIYGQDIQKLIGNEPTVSTPGIYQSLDYLGIDLGLQESDMQSRLEEFNFNGVGKVLNFVDEGLSPFAISLGGASGAIGGTFISSATGLAGAGLGVLENIIIDAATGTILVSAGTDTETNPYLATATGILVGVTTGIPRTATAIAKSKQLAKKGFTNFADNIEDLELESLGLKRTTDKSLTTLNGDPITSLSSLNRHLENLESNNKVSSFIIEGQDNIANYNSLDATISDSNPQLSEVYEIHYSGSNSDRLFGVDDLGINKARVAILNNALDDLEEIVNKEVAIGGLIVKRGISDSEAELLENILRSSGISDANIESQLKRIGVTKNIDIRSGEVTFDGTGYLHAYEGHGPDSRIIKDIHFSDEGEFITSLKETLSNPDITLSRKTGDSSVKLLYKLDDSNEFALTLSVLNEDTSEFITHYRIKSEDFISSMKTYSESNQLPSYVKSFIKPGSTKNDGTLFLQLSEGETPVFLEVITKGGKRSSRLVRNINTEGMEAPSKSLSKKIIGSGNGDNNFDTIFNFILIILSRYINLQSIPIYEYQ